MMRIHFCLANLASPLTAYCFPHENLVRSTNHNTTTTAFHGTRLDLSPVLLFLFHLAAIALSIEADRCSMHGWMYSFPFTALHNPPPLYNPRNLHFCSTPNSRDFYLVLAPNPNGDRHQQRSHIGGSKLTRTPRQPWQSETTSALLGTLLKAKARTQP
jgi:hypothetical protein